jgi:hypothetical protein
VCFVIFLDEFSARTPLQRMRSNGQAFNPGRRGDRSLFDMHAIRG